MFAICGGMPRSGSTLVYQIVCHLVEEHLQGVRLGFVHAGLLPEFRREVSDNRWRVLKAHVFDAGLQCLIDEGRSAVFYIFRDLRDVLCSIRQHAGIPVEQSLAYIPGLLDNDRMWKDHPSTLVQRYEDVVADVPRAVRQIAAHLNIGVSDCSAIEIASLYSLDANRARAQAVASGRSEQDAAGPGGDNPADRIDEHSLLLWNHIHTGEVGGWRTTLTAAQQAAVRAAANDWLVLNGYEPEADQMLPGPTASGAGSLHTLPSAPVASRKIRL